MPMKWRFWFSGYHVGLALYFFDLVNAKRAPVWFSIFVVVSVAGAFYYWHTGNKHLQRKEET